jgi:hypothetical protein
MVKKLDNPNDQGDEAAADEANKQKFEPFWQLFHGLAGGYVAKMTVLGAWAM